MSVSKILYFLFFLFVFYLIHCRWFFRTFSPKKLITFLCKKPRRWERKFFSFTFTFPIVFFFCSQWGDSLFVAIQMVIIIMQILWFSSQHATAFAFLAFCWTLATAVLYGYIPMTILTTLQALTIPITAISKVLLFSF